MRDCHVAIVAAEAGAAILRSKYGESLTRIEKSPSDFATAADLDAEKAILDVLRASRPDDAVLGEETGYTGPAFADRTWLVDPLCGTVNYAARTTLVAVNLALRTGSDIKVAVSADPFARNCSGRRPRLRSSRRRGRGARAVGGFTTGGRQPRRAVPERPHDSEPVEEPGGLVRVGRRWSMIGAMPAC